MTSRPSNAWPNRRRRVSKSESFLAPKSRDGGPPCPHYPRCIGCRFIDLPYPEQLERKQEIADRALGAYPSLAGIAVPPVTPSPRRLGYRARVKLVARRSRDEVALGLYVPGTHRVMDISSCAVHPQPVNQAASFLKRKVRELEIAPYDERDDSGDLRYIDFRYSFARRELSVTLVTRHDSFPQGLRLARALQRRFPFVAGVIQNVNERRGNVIWGERYRSLAGRDTILDELGSLKLVFPPGVFSQANPFTAAKIYETVRALAGLTGKETILDLYCGVGPISLSLARSARLVLGVDDHEPSIAAAKQNARRNGIANCRFFAGEAAETIERIRIDVPKPDLVVMNPPRKGVHPMALTAAVAMAAPKIVYVSCEPSSLARDLDTFVGHGYGVLRLQCFDMFPQTDQVETVALLRAKRLLEQNEKSSVFKVRSSMSRIKTLNPER